MLTDPASRRTLFAFLAAAACATALAAELPPRADLDARDRERIAAILAPATDFSKPERFETNQGGAGTVRRSDRDAFSQPADNLPFELRADFSVGNGVFRKLWVSAPSSTTASDGLGPLFNARACQDCHIKDGRGHPPAEGARDAVSFVVGLGVVGDDGSVGPDPRYGFQLQDFGIVGFAAEGKVAVAYDEEEVALAGGETASLRVPRYAVDSLADGPLAEGTAISPRVAPPMIGLGLLEAIHPDDLRAMADPDDADGDGISGRLALLEDGSIGRFGWKAAKATILDQAATAFAMDMGLGTKLVDLPHGDCMPAQPACLAAAIGAAEDGHEVPDELLDLVAFYSRHLAVPARRDVGDPEVLAGKALFYDAGCASCHRAKYVTSNADDVPKELRRQLIWPYSDLLLHDMGEGLADHRPQGAADGREWRTPPLWGIGVTEAVNGHTQFLHDGRARNLLEAILWHGGEAEAARQRVVAMTPAERAALLRFLGSL